MSQISKCPKVTVILSYWEALGGVSKLRYKSLLYSSSNGSYCSYMTILVEFLPTFFGSITNFCPFFFFLSNFVHFLSIYPGHQVCGVTSILTVPIGLPSPWPEFFHIHQSMTSNPGQWMVRFCPRLLAPSSTWPTFSSTTSATTPAKPQTHSDKSLAPSSS